MKNKLKSLILSPCYCTELLCDSCTELERLAPCTCDEADPAACAGCNALLDAAGDDTHALTALATRGFVCS